MSTKRKRSANYLPQETEIILKLLDQYRAVIEDKRTTAIFLARKQEAWKKICTAYNATAAVSGPRTIEQLKVFYDNKKQKTKKGLAKDQLHANKCEYLNNQNITKNDVDVTISQAKIDKMEYKKPEGSCCSDVRDHGMEILDMNKDQVTPLPNRCNSTATYFEGKTSTPGEKKEMKYVTRTTRLKNKSHFKKTTNYKQLYFRMKYQNTCLERKKIFQEIRMRQKEHIMLVQEHNFKMKCIEEKYKMKFL